MKKYLVVLLNKKEVCIDLEHVLEATTLVNYRVIPGAKIYVKGIMDYRGKVIPIIDITNDKVKNSLIVIKHKDSVFGLAVESTIGISLRNIQSIFQTSDNPFILEASDASMINVVKIAESIL